MTGRLPNAPLVYACASVRFERIGDLSKRVDDLQAILRKNGFPLYHLQSSMTVTVDQNGPRTQQQDFHIFNNADKVAGFLLAQDSLFFHALDYDTFESSIANPLGMALEAIKAVYGAIFFSFIGNRYIDWIRPGNQEPLSKYVEPQLIPISLDGMNLVGRVGLQQFLSPEGIALMIRHFGAAGHRPLPDDLIFSCSQLRSEELLSQQVTENQVVVDTDATLSFEPKEYATEELLFHIRKVHMQASAAFDSPKIFSREARQFWKGENP